jgi:hypothetical protein
MNKTHKSYIGTLNNPDVEPETFLRSFFDISKARYIVG